ncbi:hypothetical protein [Actinoplanes sp. NPDC026623]|uniref:hypothetical protein n=1 Tax=Actinoplanes sp. NPDC026623 TaxID=3155610 RepID=UPI00340EDE41
MASKATRSAGNRRVRWLTLIIAPAFGIAVVLMQAIAAGDLSVLTISLMVAAASALSGGLLGFLFGVPRAATDNSDRDDASASSRTRARYRANTNLEQISDWLTKILVGVGLIQLASLRRMGGGLIDTVAPAVGTGPASKVYAAALIIYFAIFGFLAVWLLTRLYLAPALSDTERALEVLVAAESEQNVGNQEEARQLRHEAVRILAEAQNLPRRYESLRQELAPGSSRTLEMEGVVSAARRSADSGVWTADQIRDMYDGGTDGERVFALGIMQGDSQVADTDRIVDALKQPRSSFEQLQALLAGYKALTGLDTADRKKIVGATQALLDEGRITPTGQRMIVARLIVESSGGIADQDGGQDRWK